MAETTGTALEQIQADEAADVKAAVLADPGLRNTYRHEIALREAAKLIASTGWGKDLSPRQQSAVAQYAMEVGADPVRHITLFGGKPFLGAEFYMEKAAEELPNSSIAFDMIDPKGDEAVLNGCPAFAIACCRASVWRDRNARAAGHDADAIEYNWAPNKQQKNGKEQDPVGKNDPVKTSKTRAVRRALRLVTPVMSKKVAVLEKELEQIHVQAKGTLVAQVDDDGLRKGHAPQLEAPYDDEPEPTGTELGENTTPTKEHLERIESLLGSKHVTAHEAANLRGWLEKYPAGERDASWWENAVSLYEHAIADRACAEDE